jgi:hypothetical protein
MVPYVGFYDGFWTDAAVARWKRVIDGIDDAFLDSVMTKIPVEWAELDAIHFAFNQLRLRRTKLDSLISEVEQVLTSGRFPTFQNPHYALKD